MAKVEEDRTRDGADNPDTWTKVGKCSNCGKPLVFQPDYGFPRHCPHCGVELENGTDDRPFIKQFYRKET